MAFAEYAVDGYFIEHVYLSDCNGLAMLGHSGSHDAQIINSYNCVTNDHFNLVNVAQSPT